MMTRDPGRSLGAVRLAEWTCRSTTMISSPGRTSGRAEAGKDLDKASKDFMSCAQTAGPFCAARVEGFTRIASNFSVQHFAGQAGLGGFASSHKF